MAPITELTTPQRTMGSGVIVGVFVGDGLAVPVGVRVTLVGVYVDVCVDVGVDVVIAMDSTWGTGVSEMMNRRVGEGAMAGVLEDGFRLFKFMLALANAIVMIRVARANSQPTAFLGGNPKMRKVSTDKTNAKPR